MMLPLSFLCLLSSNIPNGVIWVLAFIICVLHSYLIFFMDVKPPKRQWLSLFKFHCYYTIILKSCSLFCFGFMGVSSRCAKDDFYPVNLLGCNFELSWLGKFGDLACELFPFERHMWHCPFVSNSNFIFVQYYNS